MSLTSGYNADPERTNPTTEREAGLHKHDLERYNTLLGHSTVKS